LACVPGQPRAPSPIKAVWPSLPCASPLSSASPASCIASRRRQSCRATCRCRLLTSIRRLGAQPEQNDPTKSFARTSCTQGASSSAGHQPERRRPIQTRAAGRLLCRRSDSGRALPSPPVVSISIGSS
jgi:hypothetical protein